ncbi:MAG: hypothetical protein FJY62_00450 [Betaproteobacteria bacterium]|nr:hypothetical protein [Betaproteobacteria bacterium]
MKLLSACVFFLLSPVLMSSTVNLTCDVAVKTKTRTAEVGEERGRAAVEIKEISDELFVKVRSEISTIDFFNVDTLVFDDTRKMSVGTNLSTGQKWEITQSSGRKKNGKIETVTERRFFVDRGSGLIVLSTEFTVSGGQLFVTASGTCLKASSERMF